MKSLKFQTLVLALLAGLVFTSCNSKSESPVYRTAIVQTAFDGSFIDVDGTKLIPTNPSLNTTADMVYIYCQINGEQPANAKSISITLMADPVNLDANSQVISSVSSPENIPGNTAIYTLAVNNGQYIAKPYLFNHQTLILPIGFFVKSGLTNASINEEIAKHKFELVYYADSATAGDKELKVYLRQTVTDPDTSRENLKTWAYKAYNIGSIIDSFKIATGGIDPSRIVIYAKENTNSDKLADAEEESYPLDYTFN